MGQSLQGFLERRHQQKEEREKSDPQALEKRRIKFELYKDQMRQVQTLLSNNEIDSIEDRLQFRVLQYLKDHITPDEQKTISSLKTQFQRQTYIMTGIAFVTAFVLPLPFKFIRERSNGQRFIIWISLFGVTHYLGMYRIRHDVSVYNKQLISRYKDIILRDRFEPTSEK